MAKLKKSEIIFVIGGQWGDEGKGKVIDYLATDANMVIRAQGGDNAGHTVINDQGKFALHLIPSGIFNPETQNIIGTGTVVNPDTLVDEIAGLHTKDISTANLSLSEKAHLILDYQKEWDKIWEEQRGKNKVGTTGKGIGPTYAAKAARRGLRTLLLNDPKRFYEEVKRILALERQLLPSNLQSLAAFDPDYYSKKIPDWCEKLARFVTNTENLVLSILQKGGKVLVEGAQATLLDIDYGTYPNTTSSNPTAGGLVLGAGIPIGALGNSDVRVFGVFKAYQTRVGEGAMPTELKGQIAEYIRNKGHEYGTTTGRPRRVGFFDGAAAKYAHKINGFTDIVITRLDILTGVPELKICSAYQKNGQVADFFPADDFSLAKLTPVYAKDDIFRSWKEDIAGVRKFADLPKQAQRYCLRIAEFFPGAKLSLIGTGAERNSLIVV